MSGIVVYSDVIVPYSVLRAGATGKLKRTNDRTSNQGGFVTVNVVMDETLRQYTLGVKPMLLADWQRVHGAYEVTDAGAYGMLLEDPTDSKVSAAEGALMGYMAGVEFGAVGRGNGTPLYGFRKIYTAFFSTRTKALRITRPRAPAILRGGTPVVVGAGAGNISLSTGPVYGTFVADASRTVTAVTVGATTQVTLATTIPGFVVGGRLWLQDLTGTDAALLNNFSHEITAITGVGSNVYTLATNTAGKTITAAGTGKKYPQPDETLTWSGDYYVPVQFASDDMDWDFLLHGVYDSRLIAGPSVQLVEIREA